MRYVAVVLALMSAPALGQDRPTYCRVPETGARTGENYLNIMIGSCMPGDVVAIPSARPEWIGRLCDFTKPVTGGAQFTMCRLADSVGPIRDDGASSGLRQQPFLGRR